MFGVSKEARRTVAALLPVAGGRSSRTTRTNVNLKTTDEAARVTDTCVTSMVLFLPEEPNEISGRVL
jgi:hypothetical protein